jgi:SAM-dependent methyltransferase
MSSSSRTSRRRGGRRADRADRYDLYQRSVQSPDVDVAFLDRVYRKRFGRRPLLLGEDFCGTGAVACAWAASHRERRAWGRDLDPEPLAWGREHNVAPLPERAQRRVHLLEGDVREEGGRRFDVVCAQNFSYFVFRTREALEIYFRAVRSRLRREGLFVLDVMGGSECLEEDREEVRRVDGFRYVWEQRRFDPISNACAFSIHFLFPDGSALHHAFTYDWRLWTIPELREVLRVAGFSRTDVYWEDTDQSTGEGNGVYRQRRSAPADPSWVAYIVASR